MVLLAVYHNVGVAILWMTSGLVSVSSMARDLVIESKLMRNVFRRRLDCRLEEVEFLPVAIRYDCGR
jgi:hypothetical protein